MVMIVLLIIVLVEDLKMKRISNRIILVFGWCALIEHMIQGDFSVKERIFAACVVIMPMVILMFVFPGAFGGGDIKLLFMLGLFQGVYEAMQGLCITVILAGIYSAYLILKDWKNRKKEIAFGPFISIGFSIGFCLEMYAKYKVN